MAFYNEISKYYDDIFPVKKQTVQFLQDMIGRPPKKVLDVACGTGGYTMELASAGYELAAIDLDDEMIHELNNKLADQHEDIRFLQGNMLDLENKFHQETFDAIYCIGNSLVHLESEEQISELFKQVRKLMKADGVFVFQIINYNRVIEKGISSLPTIVNNVLPLKFERVYQYDDNNKKINFITTLSVENKVIQNKIELMPLMYKEIIYLLQSAGFDSINAYGDFNKNQYITSDSYALIIEAK